MSEKKEKIKEKEYEWFEGETMRKGKEEFGKRVEFNWKIKE